jgi:hypothetical protein
MSGLRMSYIPGAQAILIENLINDPLAAADGCYRPRRGKKWD